MARTLYDVLGVSSRATPDELRQAYRERARALHPDRLRADGRDDGDGLGAGMRELNDAWRVLRDPAARAVYDRSLAPPAPPRRDPFDEDEDDWDRPFRGRPAEPGDLVVLLVRALPWLVVGLILGGIFVFTAFAGGSDDPRSRKVGDCVQASLASDVVPCAPGASRVEAVTHTAAECPSGTLSVDTGNARWLCLRPITGASP